MRASDLGALGLGGALGRAGELSQRSSTATASMTCSIVDSFPEE